MNLLTETKEAIQNSGHAIEDVMFIGSDDGEYRLTWDEFIKIADFEYNCGLGAAEIATDLIIYFHDHSYITRGEYDGSEWWEYNEPKLFSIYDNFKPINCLGGDGVMWETIRDLNKAPQN